MAERCTGAVVAAFTRDLARQLEDARGTIAAARRALDGGQPTSASVELDRISDQVALAHEIAGELLFAAGRPVPVPPAPGRARLPVVLGAWRDELEGACRERGIAVSTGVEGEAHVELDVAKLRRLLGHLAALACHGRGGELEARASVEGAGPGQVVLALHVERRPPPGDVRAGREDDDARDLHETLARRLALALGGSLEVLPVAPPARGFRARVPARALPKPVAPEAGSFGGGRALVVEDDRDGRAALALLLEDWGFEVLPCDSGEEAIRRSGRGSFRVALLDVELPGLSGFDVRDALRAHDPELPIVFLSGTERARDGHDRHERHLLKPVDLEALEAALGALLAPES